MEEKNAFEINDDDAIPLTPFQVEFAAEYHHSSSGDLALSSGRHVPPPGTFEVLAQSSFETSVDEAIEIIKAHLDSGKSFTNAQIDVCTQVLATQLPVSERDMLVEIAQQNEYPLWVGMLAQWRRCVEYSEQYAVLIDPDWQKKIDERKEEVNGAVVVVDDAKNERD